MQFVILSSEHPDRDRAEVAVRAIYREQYSASVCSFAPNLAVLYGADRKILCAAGMRLPSDRFFSESYIDLPAEQYASAVLGRPVDRGEIVEISTLAGVRNCATGLFLSRFVNGTRAIGATMMLFTATARLRTYLRRNNVDIVELGPALRDRLPGWESWGSYYDQDPRVCLTPDSSALPFRMAPRQPFAGDKISEAA